MELTGGSMVVGLDFAGRLTGGFTDEQLARIKAVLMECRSCGATCRRAPTKVAGATAQMPQPIVTATSHLGFSCSVREDKR